MKLYLVQHAKAAPEQIDPQRPLTKEGKADLQKIAAFIKPLNLCVDYCWHSRKKRAEQTAEILTAVIKVRKAKIARDGLGPNDDVKILKDELSGTAADIIIVSHMPFVSRLASLLLTNSESAEPVAFRQGGIVALSRAEPENWQLDWMLTPQLLA